VPVLEKHFGDWKAKAAMPVAASDPAVASQKKPRVFLIDQPGAVQANIVAAQLAPSSTDPRRGRLRHGQHGARRRSPRAST
jgi:zinc protease